jgi:hypothetical protein
MTDIALYVIKAPPCRDHFVNSALDRTYSDAEMSQIRRKILDQKPDEALDRLFRLMDARPNLPETRDQGIKAIVEKAFDYLTPSERREYVPKLANIGYRPIHAPGSSPTFFN